MMSGPPINHLVFPIKFSKNARYRQSTSPRQAAEAPRAESPRKASRPGSSPESKANITETAARGRTAAAGIHHGRSSGAVLDVPPVTLALWAANYKEVFGQRQITHAPDIAISV